MEERLIHAVHYMYPYLPPSLPPSLTHSLPSYPSLPSSLPTSPSLLPPSLSLNRRRHPSILLWLSLLLCHDSCFLPHQNGTLYWTLHQTSGIHVHVYTAGVCESHNGYVYMKKKHIWWGQTSYISDPWSSAGNVQQLV